MAKWAFTYETHNERIYLICPSVKGDLLVFQDMQIRADQTKWLITFDF